MKRPLEGLQKRELSLKRGFDDDWGRREGSLCLAECSLEVPAVRWWRPGLGSPFMPGPRVHWAQTRTFTEDVTHDVTR